MKRFIALSSVFAGLLSAQETGVTTTKAVDINGHRVGEGPDVVQRYAPGSSGLTEIMQSVNGRMVPLRRVEERVLRDDANGRLVERLIRRYDPTGNPLMPERQTIEEQKHGSNGSTIQTSTYRTDLNGHPELIERSITERQISGSRETEDTVLQRPTLNGSLEAVEKRSTVTVKGAGGNYQSETEKSLRGQNGGFYVTVKQSTEHTEQGSQSSDNTVEYEMGFEGRLELHNQTVTKTIKRTDGSQGVEVDLYGKHVPGTVQGNGSDKLKLYEQQLIEKKKVSGGVVETLSVRRPNVTDPKVLGPAMQLSETVCRGKCEL